MALPIEKYKKGGKVLINDDPYEIVEYTFVKPGKGQALYKCRLRNMLKGGMLDKTFRSGDSLEEANVSRNDGSYSYRDGDSFYFLDAESFEQYALSAEAFADQMRFVMEGSEVQLLFFNGNLISMTPPQQIIQEVTYTEPAAKGDTATNVTKGQSWNAVLKFRSPRLSKKVTELKLMSNPARISNVSHLSEQDLVPERQDASPLLMTPMFCHSKKWSVDDG